MLPRRTLLTLLSAPATWALALPTQARSRQVALSGVLGRKALLTLDGSALRSLAEGETYQGVRLIRLGTGEATVEVDGSIRTLRLGEAPVHAGSASGEGSSATPSGRMVLTADSRGHFTPSVRINDQLVNAVIDTGASTIAIGKRDADRLRLDYQQAPTLNVGTANGTAKAWSIRLHSVRMGDVQLWNLEAVVVPQDMPFVLLGNNFLSEFSMSRHNDQMVLIRRQ